MKKFTSKVLCVMLALVLCLGVSVTGFASNVAARQGIIGLDFNGRTSVIAGDTIEGSIYTYDVGGADAFELTFSYDATAFSNLDVEATDGVTILASKKFDNTISVVIMVDPATADYSNLLKIFATAGPDETVGSISISWAEAANRGDLIAFMISDTDSIFIMTEGLITDFTIQTLSLAMTYYLYDKNHPNWSAASRFDMNDDGVIDLLDFIFIANAILDNQRISNLRFNEGGTFKILQVTDVQDHLRFSTGRNQMDQRTANLLNALVEAEEPDLIMITGDNHGANMNAEEFSEYMHQFVKMFDATKTPWIITYGNHDEDATTALAQDGWNAIKQLAYIRSNSEYSVNRATMSGATGFYPNGRTYAVGDMYQLIYDSEGRKPVYNVWALDSNRYVDTFSRAIGGDNYDWVRPAQINWYYRTSQLLENKYGKLDSLMYMHIPLPEWGIMWTNHHATNRPNANYGIVGERNEREYPAAINSGLYLAAYERGDVRGMFVGHEHINDYVGNFHGIYLGYAGNIGYATYGLGGAQNNRMRGGRIFELNENDLSTFETRMVYQAEVGINE